MKRGEVKYTPEELEKAVDAYFAWCQEPEQWTFAIVGKHRVEIPRIPMWIDLALYLGVDRETLRRWMEGEYNYIPEELRKALTKEQIAEQELEAQKRVRGILTRAKERIINDAFIGAGRGVYNERATAFRLGRMGETVKQEVQHSGGMAVAWQGVDPADADKYSQ